MIVKNDEVQEQEQTKRLRFKPLANVHLSSGDNNMDKSVKETKSKGKILQKCLRLFAHGKSK